MTLLADLGNRVGVDLWHYQTPDGRSLRLTLDWVYPFAAGEKKWTHPQIEAFDRTTLLVPYRRAEAAYQDVNYETVIAKTEHRSPGEQGQPALPGDIAAVTI